MILTKIAPKDSQVSYGFEIEDEIGGGVKKRIFEQNVIIAHFNKFCLVTIYAPNAVSTLSEQRIRMRREWDQALETCLQELKEKHPDQVLIVIGDFNVCHNIKVDVHADLISKNEEEEPMDDEEIMDEEEIIRTETEKEELLQQHSQNKISSNQHPHINASEIKRMLSKNFKQLLQKTGLVDTFRERNPGAKRWTYWNTRKKARNQDRGRRLDYALAEKSMLENNMIISSSILGDI